MVRKIQTICRNIVPLIGDIKNRDESFYLIVWRQRESIIENILPLTLNKQSKIKHLSSIKCELRMRA